MEIRLRSAKALGRLQVKSAAPRLVRLLVDPQASVRAATAAAVSSLGLIGAKSAVDALLEGALRPTEEIVRLLETFGTSLAELAPPLLAHQDERLNLAGARLLVKCGADTTPARAVLGKILLHSPESANRAQSASLIALLGSEPGYPIPLP